MSQENKFGSNFLIGKTTSLLDADPQKETNK